MGRGSSKVGAKNASSKNGGSAPSLDKKLVERANAAGIAVDFGDSTTRQYNSNVSEIQKMDLSSSEKKEAINKLHTLTENQLRAEGNARNPYSMGEGVARPNARQMSKNADKRVAEAQKVKDFMGDLRKKQEKKKKEAASQRLAEGLQKAMKAGDLTVTIDGVTYKRSSKRSKSFTVVR